MKRRNQALSNSTTNTAPPANTTPVMLDINAYRAWYLMSSGHERCPRITGESLYETEHIRRLVRYFNLPHHCLVLPPCPVTPTTFAGTIANALRLSVGNPHILFPLQINGNHWILLCIRYNPQTGERHITCFDSRQDGVRGRFFALLHMGLTIDQVRREVDRYLPYDTEVQFNHSASAVQQIHTNITFSFQRGLQRDSHNCGTWLIEAMRHFATHPQDPLDIVSLNSNIQELRRNHAMILHPDFENLEKRAEFGPSQESDDEESDEDTEDDEEDIDEEDIDDEEDEEDEESDEDTDDDDTDDDESNDQDDNSQVTLSKKNERKDNSIANIIMNKKKGYTLVGARFKKASTLGKITTCAKCTQADIKRKQLDQITQLNEFIYVAWGLKRPSGRLLLIFRDALGRISNYVIYIGPRVASQGGSTRIVLTNQEASARRKRSRGCNSRDFEPKSKHSKIEPIIQANHSKTSETRVSESASPTTDSFKQVFNLVDMSNGNAQPEISATSTNESTHNENDPSQYENDTTNVENLETGENQDKTDADSLSDLFRDEEQGSATNVDISEDVMKFFDSYESDHVE